MSPLLCDPIWHVSSSSGVATSVSELLYPCYLLLLWTPTLGTDLHRGRRRDEAFEFRRVDGVN